MSDTLIEDLRNPHYDPARVLERAIDDGGNERQIAIMLADAIEIADSCARSDIECNCHWIGDVPDQWYDTSIPHEDCRDAIALSVRYLEARGLIVRDPNNRHHVRFKA